MEGMTINERSFRVRVSAAVSRDGEGGRRPLITWKTARRSAKTSTSFGMFWNSRKKGLNDPGRLPSSSRIRFSWEEGGGPRSESRQGSATKIDVDASSVEDASPGNILNDKHEELWSY